MRRFFAQLAVEPGPRHRPIRFCRAVGNAKDLRYLIEAKAAEEVHFYHPALTGIQTCKLLQRLIERHQIRGLALYSRSAASIPIQQLKE